MVQDQKLNQLKIILLFSDLADKVLHPILSGLEKKSQTTHLEVILTCKKRFF